MIFQVIEALVLLAALVFLFIHIRKEGNMNRQRIAECEAVLKQLQPTSEATGDEQGTEPEATGEVPAASLVPFDNQSPLNKEQFLLAVTLYAEAQARYDVLTYHSRCDLLAMNQQQAAALVHTRTSYSRGSTLYGSGEIFTKYPEVSPVEFIEAYDRSYRASVNSTVNAIQAATVAASK